jgi:adenylate kinase
MRHGIKVFGGEQVIDHLEDIMAEGGNVIDHHSSDFFPERFFDLVVVLQTDNTLLYDRLKARGYSEKKISENVQCEIMHVPCEEVQRSYKQEIVQILSSNDSDEMEQNVERIVEWVRQYIAAHRSAS